MTQYMIFFISNNTHYMIIIKIVIMKFVSSLNLYIYFMIILLSLSHTTFAYMSKVNFKILNYYNEK